MRIVLLSDGNSIHTARWVNAFVERGHEVYLLYNKDQCPRVHNIDSRVKQIPLKFKGKVGYYLNAYSVKKIVKKINPDIVNVHYASGYGTLARQAHLKKYILSVWGSDVYEFPNQSRLKKCILKKNIKNAGMLASTSICMAHQLRKVVKDPSLDIAVTPFGIDLKLFDPKRFKKKDDLEVVIGNIKSFEKNYGILELILAFEVLKKELEELAFKKKVKLVLYGEGTQKEKLQKIIEEKCLENDIKLMERISNDNVPEVLNSFDIFCALSYSESFGVSAVEAMAMEKPIVVSDADGFEEVVGDRKSGIIVKRGDIKSIEKALKMLVLDTNMRINMGTAGRERVKKLYDWENNVDCMLKLYEKAKFKRKETSI